MNVIKSILFVFFFGAVVLSFDHGPALAGIQKNALLIGISDYSKSGLSSLPGCRNDIKATREVLIQSLGMDPERIIVLLDGQATHSGIIDAMETLNKQVNEGDFVYIHYSGHGSYMPDLNGDEPRGTDQTWVSFGARSEEKAGTPKIDNYDVLDDEISHLLAPIYEKAGQVVFVSDSCHSGTVSRGGSAPVHRAAGIDNRMHPKGMQAYVQADFTKGVFIGATEDTKPAYETIQNGQSFGLFSWHWLQALQSASPNASWHELFRQTQACMKAKSNIVQYPQISGNSTVTLIGNPFPAPVNTVDVTCVDGQKITIGAGAVSGITPGSIFIKKGGAPSAGRLEIQSVQNFSSRGLAREGAFRVGDQLIVHERFYPRPVLQVFVRGDSILSETDTVLKQIRGIVTGVPGVTLAKLQSQADLVLYYMRKEKGVAGRLPEPTGSLNLRQTLPPSSLDGKPEILFLEADETAFGDGLWLSWPEKGNTDLLTQNLHRIRNAQTLRSLGSSGNAKPPVNVEFVHMHKVENCGANTNGTCQQFPFGNFEVDPPAPGARFDGKKAEPGDVLSFNLENTSGTCQYVYLINIMSNGNIKCIYPTPDMTTETHRLDKGERREQIPAALRLDRAGTETIKVVTATQPVDVRLFEQGAYTSRQAGKSSGNMNALEQLLEARAAPNSQARGTLVSFGSMAWAAHNVDVSVKPPFSAVQKGARGHGDAGETYVRVSVLFGCNRNYLADERKVGDRFGNDRGELRMGRLWVSIPPNHKPGELEAPSILSLRREDPNKHLMLQSITFLNETQFKDAVQKAAGKVPENRLLLYIHGYNNSFELAARRTAQIAYDLSTEGISYVPLLFTWPSGNSINPTQYTRAWTNKEWAVPDLIRFIQVAVDQTGMENVHVLAHSMGTNLFSTAAVHLAHNSPENRKRFGEVIFAAPDIDAQTFYKLLMPNLSQIANRTTVYTASQDVALYVSRIVHSGYHRLGDSSRGVLVRQGTDLVDVSTVNTSDMGHAYYASIKKLIQDISLTVEGIHPPNRDLLRVFSNNKEKYWKVKNSDTDN